MVLRSFAWYCSQQPAPLVHAAAISHASLILSRAVTAWSRPNFANLPVSSLAVQYRHQTCSAILCRLAVHKAISPMLLAGIFLTWACTGGGAHCAGPVRLHAVLHPQISTRSFRQPCHSEHTRYITAQQHRWQQPCCTSQQRPTRSSSSSSGG